MAVDRLMSEREAKAYAAKMQGGLGGMNQCAEPYAGTTACDEPCRVGVRERVQDLLREASRQGRKQARLHELSVLLDKNPDVARILDLLEEVCS